MLKQILLSCLLLSLLITVCQAQVINDFIAHYPFDANANDASGNGNNGLVSGPILVADRFNQASSAYRFDGVDDEISTVFNLATNLPFSLSVWVSWDGDDGGFQEILSWWDPAQGQSAYLGISPVTGEIRFGDTFGSTGVNLPSLKWVHIAATYDGNVSRLYLDGELLSTSEENRDYDFTNGAMIIGKQRTSQEHWDGIIDDIHVFGRAITDEEVVLLFEAGKFITTWLTTTTSESITIPTTGLGYNYTVDWGDGTIESGFTGNATHIYDFPGTKRVSISGDFPRIFFNNSGDNLKIITIEQWGDIAWTSMESAFETCQNLTYNATDAPNLMSVTNMSQMFRGTTLFNGDINNWDVSTVSNMSEMFLGAISFNQSLDSWNVFSVTSFNKMFEGAASFDQSLRSWNIGNAADMLGMLDGSGLSTANYDASVKGWANISQIPTNIQLGATGLTFCNPNDRNFLIGLGWTFNDDGSDPNCQFVTTWQTTSNNETITIPIHVEGVYTYEVDWGDGVVETGLIGNALHTYATAGTYTVSIRGDFPRIFFNDLGDKNKIMTVEQWGKILWSDFSQAFAGCSNLTIPATDAPVLNDVISLFSMFARATSFNQSINHWDVSTIENISFMFQDATQFDQPLDQWDVSNVTNMQGVFNIASAFNQDISAWNTSNVTNMSSIFDLATSFDQPLNSWDVSNVTTMSLMFQQAPFNQTLEDWDVGNVTDMSNMFVNAGFDQPIGNWDIRNVTNMTNMFNGAAISTPNYDAALIGWAEQTVQTSVPIGASGITYCVGEAARNTLINTYNWTFTGDEKSCNTETDFVSFSLAEELAAATINTTSHTITINVTEGTDLTALVATFELSAGASATVGSTPQESAVTPNDFSIPVTYAVTAEDGTTTQDWTVTINLGEPITQTETLPDNSARIPYSSPGRNIENYRIVAIPFSGKTVSSTFEELLPIDPARWRLVTHNSTSNSYSNASSSLSPGVGYFFISAEQVTINVGGNGHSLTNEAFSKPLQQGFNLIGNPFTGALNWDEVLSYNIDQGNITDADNKGLITFEGGFRFEQRTTLAAYEGAFVFVDIAITNFAIPISASTAGGRVNYHTQSSPGSVNIDKIEWELGFYLDTDEFGYDIAAIGLRDDAHEDWDKHDFPHIPQFEKFVKIDFGDGRSRDFRPSDPYKNWSFTIPNNLDQKTFSLEWDKPVSDHYTVMLLDGQGGKLYDLKKTDKITIASDPAAEHQIVFGRPDDIVRKLQLNSAALVGLYPNPTEEMLNFILVMPKTDRAMVSVTSLTGKNISQSTHNLATGHNSIVLDTSKVPTGVYILKIEVAGQKKTITSKFLKR